MVVAYRYVQTLASSVGTGETRKSPDKQYQATAYDWTSVSFWGQERHRFEFKVEDTASGQVIQRLETDPIPGPYFGSRSSHSVVHWCQDSTEVLFKFPDIDIKMKVAPQGDPN